MEILTLYFFFVKIGSGCNEKFLTTAEVARVLLDVEGVMQFLDQTLTILVMVFKYCVMIRLQETDTGENQRYKEYIP